MCLLKAFQPLLRIITPHREFVYYCLALALSHVLVCQSAMRCPCSLVTSLCVFTRDELIQRRAGIASNGHVSMETRLRLKTLEEKGPTGPGLLSDSASKTKLN